MRSWTVIIGVTICVLHLLAESHSFIGKLFPKLYNTNVNWFIVKENTPTMSVIWYFKFVFDDFLLFGIFGIMAMYFKQHSLPLAKICWVWSIYYVVSIWSFAYDYKSSPIMYWAMLAAEILTTIIILLTAYKKLRIVK